MEKTRNFKSSSRIVKRKKNKPRIQQSLTKIQQYNSPSIRKRKTIKERIFFSITSSVKMVDPIPLRASAREIWAEKEKEKGGGRGEEEKKRRHERRNLAGGGILSRAAYDQDYLRGNLRIQ